MTLAKAARNTWKVRNTCAVWVRNWSRAASLRVMADTCWKPRRRLRRHAAETRLAAGPRRAQPHRHQALRLGAEHSGEPLQRAQGAVRLRREERDLEILPLGVLELHLEEVADGVVPHVADDE